LNGQGKKNKKKKKEIRKKEREEKKKKKTWRKYLTLLSGSPHTIFPVHSSSSSSTTVTYNIYIPTYTLEYFRTHG
jgi:hypothetical protein